MYAQPLTPSNYSDSEEETSYAGNKNQGNDNDSPQQQSNYMSYPTPSTLNGETSNDTTDTDTASSYNQFQNVQFTNFSLENIAGLKPTETKEDNFYNPYYQMQYPSQMVGNSNPYDQYQQGLNNELVQSYSVANFDFSSNVNYQQKLEQSPPNAPNASKYEDQSSAYDDQSAEENNQMSAQLKPDIKATITKPKNKTETTSDYLMRPPDSESIAAAAATAKKNRGKRRTRIKFEKEQLDLLEAAFQRTHYPDVNIVDRLSEVLSITTDKISIWFQNRRAKHKRTKKPVGSEQITLFREIENPMDLIEAAQKEIQLKNLAAQDDLNSSADTTRDNRSPVSEYSVNNELSTTQQQANLQPALNTTDQNAADDEDSNDQFTAGVKADQQKFYASDYATSTEACQHQAYLPHMMYSQQQPGQQHGMTTSFSNHQFYQHAPLLDASQFYQPPVEKLSSSESENQKQSRTSLSSESGSNDSRSGSPQSDSSENPEHSEIASNSSENSYHQQPQLLQEYQYVENAGYEQYPYLQPNMLGPHYQQQGYIRQDNLHQQQYMPQQQQPLPNFSNIFQPYADCTKTEPVEHLTNNYMPNFAQMNTAYYPQYYNQ